MHFVMYGAGAIGGAIGARLTIKGHPVTLIARGNHAEVIREKGLRYRDPTRDLQLQIPCVTHPDQVNWQADSVVIATMKAQDSAEAFETLYATVGDQYPLFCAQNGIANEALAQRYFSQVHAMLVVLPATYLTAGEVIHSA
ncbi:MAG: ketopantoate reductase family protein, partial [Pseudomonadales bacterium]